MKKMVVFCCLVVFGLFFTACGDDAKKPEIKISISPTAKTVTAGESVSLTVTAQNTEVVWPTTVQGSFTKTGNTAVYTPPPNAGEYKFTVTAKADSAKVATATITVTIPPPPPEPTVAITTPPSGGKIPDFTEFQFVAEVSDGKTVKWSVEGGIGEIDQDGLFTADGHPGDGKVIATITGNSGQEISAEVEITVERGAEWMEVMSKSLPNPVSDFGIVANTEGAVASTWDGENYHYESIPSGEEVDYSGTGEPKLLTGDGQEYALMTVDFGDKTVVVAFDGGWDPPLFSWTNESAGGAGVGYNSSQKMSAVMFADGVLIIKGFSVGMWIIPYTIPSGSLPVAVYPIDDLDVVVAYANGEKSTQMRVTWDPFSFALPEEGDSLAVDGRVTAITQTEDGKYRISVIRENPDGKAVGLVLETAYPDSL